jgi:hypothetical protein
MALTINLKKKVHRKVWESVFTQLPVATAAGAMRCVRLEVAGAFHTVLMQAAVDRLAAALEETTIHPPRIPVVSNVDARPHADPAEVGLAFNQALICDSTVAGGDFRVNGHFSDDTTVAHDRTFCSRTIPPGLWRTKALRQVAQTAPYFRNGQAATLDEVIAFYDRGGDAAGSFLGGPAEIRPLHLTGDERQQLKAFLLTLTGEPVAPSLLRDTHKR